MKISRQTFLQICTGAILATAAHSCPQAKFSQAESANSSKPASEPPIKIKIAYPTVAAGLPFFFAVEKGFFKEAGLDVDAVKFASPQKIVEAMITGQFHGFCNGTPSAPLGVVEIASPGLFKIIASNFNNAKYVLDEFIVAQDSPIQSIALLKGKKVGCGPSPQHLAFAKGILKKNGVEDAEVTQMEIAQHLAAVSSGQLDAAYTVEPIAPLIYKKA